MTPVRHGEFRALALKVLAGRAGSSPGAQDVAACAQRAYGELASVCAPLIGRAGVEALTARAVYLSQQEYPWLLNGTPAAPVRGAGDARIEPFVPVVARLSGQDPVVAAHGAAAVLAMLLGLLVTLIGRPLTVNLIRHAWTETASDAHTQEM